MSQTRSDQIRTLNDAFRRHLNGHGQLLITRGVEAAGEAFVMSALGTVQEFDDFSEDNDPYGEHDFGAFELDGRKLFWKIDCYDRSLEAGSPDPADPEVTCRVLTVMLADEY